MKSAAAFLVATSAAFASAQVTFNSTTGKYTCAKPNVAYCAGDSLKTDIIIRCDANGVGQPGRCTDVCLFFFCPPSGSCVVGEQL